MQHAKPLTGSDGRLAGFSRTTAGPVSTTERIKVRRITGAEAHVAIEFSSHASYAGGAAHHTADGHLTITQGDADKLAAVMTSFDGLQVALNMRAVAQAVHQVIELYAESYESMGGDGAGTVQGLSVARDLRANIGPQIVTDLELLSARPAPAHRPMLIGTGDGNTYEVPGTPGRCDQSTAAPRAAASSEQPGVSNSDLYSEPRHAFAASSESVDAPEPWDLYQTGVKPWSHRIPPNQPAHVIADAMQEELNELRPIAERVADVRKDAERYQWMCANGHKPMPDDLAELMSGEDAPTKANIDAAIDAAMSAFPASGSQEGGA